MSDPIPASLQRRVRLRAGDRCEYCRLAQAGQEATFHVDHVVPRVAGGPTVLENLALACVSCSLRKGARITAIDPSSGDTTQLFHPRRDEWTIISVRTPPERSWGSRRPVVEPSSRCP
jgi:hypothetical protein